MVLILDGNSEHVAPGMKKNWSFLKKNIQICDFSRFEQILNRPNNRDHYTRAHLFLDYHEYLELVDVFFQFFFK